MGNFNSGRRPIPTAIKALRGKQMRPGNFDEARHPVGRPEMPPHVAGDPLMQAQWERFAKVLTDAGVLTTAHGEVLTLLVVAYANFLRALDQFAAMGYQHLVVDTTTDPQGWTLKRVKVNPLKREIDRNLHASLRLLAEFGLTPVSGPKVPTQEARARREDPFEVFLGGKAR
jgi:P27 family predicted phage terminase small subunit